MKVGLIFLKEFSMRPWAQRPFHFNDLALMVKNETFGEVRERVQV